MDNEICLEREDAQVKQPSLDRLKTCWLYFSNQTDGLEKVKWIQLFIVEYKRIMEINVDTFETELHQCRFLSTAASQLTCFLLQLVDDIIVSSKTVNGSLEASTNSDITTIVALREFLMGGIGGRILEVLLTIDTKNMLCARELAGLLVNIFPTSSWDENDRLEHTEIMDDIQALDIALSRLETSVKQRFTRNNQHAFPGHRDKLIVANDHSISSEWNSTDALSMDNFTNRSMTRLSGEHIGSLVLSLVSKLVLEDSSITVGPDAGYVTMQCLAFALDMYTLLPTNAAFSSHNQHIFHQRLLAIICGCISTTFVKQQTQVSIDLTVVLQRMFAVANKIFVPESENVSPIVKDHMQGFCLFVAFCLQKCAQQTEIAIYHKLNNVIESQSQFIIKMFASVSSFRLLLLMLKVIQSLRSKTPIDSLNKRRYRKRSQIMASSYSFKHHYERSNRLGCSLERIVLRLAEHLTNPTQLCLVFRHFHHNLQCCCNTDLSHLAELLRSSRQAGSIKQYLQFMRHNILRLTFASSAACEICERRRIEFTSGLSFYQMYIDTTLTTDAPAMLKHVAKIAKLLPFGMSCRIMIEILLPTFRREKQLLTEENSISNDLVSLCLNAFLCYLRDIRLIKGFFNDENIQHLSDLMVLPEFASLVCCLLKIGLDNESFLGENCGDQLVLSEKLRSIQSRSLRMVSEAINHMFRAIQREDRGQLQLRFNKTDDLNDPNDIITKLKTKSLTAYQLLQLAVIYWNMILQLLRRKNDRKLQITDSPIALSSQEQETLLYTVQNSLSCFLYLQNPVNSEDPNIESTRYIWVSLDNLVDDISTAAFSCNHVPNKMFNSDSVSPTNSDIYNSENNITYPSEFSQNLSTSDSDLVFDLRLTKTENQNLSTASSFTNIFVPIDTSSAGIVEKGILCKRLEIPQSDVAPSSAVQNVLQFLSTNVLEVFFPATTDDSNSIGSRTSDEERAFSEAIGVATVINSPEHKKLFLQLFEITCGVLMSSIQQSTNVNFDEFSNEMSYTPSTISPQPWRSRNPMNDIKTILLRHAERINDDSTHNGSAIVAALHSLLKCAEMRYKCCFVEDCTHASYSRATNNVAASGSRTTNTTSMNDGGDNQCCSSSVKTSNFVDNDGAPDETHHQQPNGEPAKETGLGDDRRLKPNDNNGEMSGSFSSDVDRTDGDLGLGEDGFGEWTASSDDSFMTADEGYDGDAELAGSVCSDEDANANLVRNSQIPSSRYRTQVVHADICRIVVDILIELSKCCLNEPEFWPKYLLPIVVQLSAIRDSIGGSLFLLKGFALILECSDIRLRDFQKAILELISDVNTPDTLTTYFGILASGTHPPVDLLLTRLIYLESNGHRAQPNAQLTFPTTYDCIPVTDANPLASKSIQEVRDFHIYHRLRTAITRSTYIFPLHYLGFRPWSPSGFTVAVWINPQSNSRYSGAASQSSGFGGSSSLRSEPFMSNSSPIKQTLPCSANCSWDEKTHLVSVGSNRLLLSIYFHSHDPSTMFFQLTKPNSPIINHKANASKMPRSQTADDFSDDNTTTSQKGHQTESACQCTWRRSRVRHPHQTNSNAQSATDPIGLNVLSSTCNALKTTRIALQNSFSQFNLFSASGLGPDSFEYQSHRYPLEVKGVRLARNKWSHLAFSVIASSKEMTVRITVDGVDYHDIHLPCFSSPKYEKFQLICLGDTIPAEASQSDQFGLRYSIAHLQLYQRNFTQPDILSQMVALGPDCPTFVDCDIRENLPNFGLLNAQKCRSAGTTSRSDDLMRNLRENIVATFSASDPFVINCYNRINSSKEAIERISIMTCGRGAIPSQIVSFQTATILCGGISSLFYLFARVVELTESEKLQAAALSFVLRTIHTNGTLYSEFRRKDGMCLLSPIIKSDRCRKGIVLLNAILEVACDYPVLTLRPDNQFFVNGVTSACLLYPNLLVSVIHRYSDWHTHNQPNAEVIEMLLVAIQALVREKHPRQSVNIERLNEVGLIPILLHFCKLYLVGIPNPVNISVKTAESLISLVSIFAGAPPSATLLDDIAKVLLLLHRPSDSFITHDRSKFYFLSTPTVLVKPKQRLSLPHLPSGRRLSLSMHRRIITATTDPKPVNLMQRSVSLNTPQVSLNVQTDESPMTTKEEIFVPSSIQRLMSMNQTIENPTEVEDALEIPQLKDLPDSSCDDSDNMNRLSAKNYLRDRRRQTSQTLSAVGAAAQKAYRNRAGASNVTRRRIVKRISRRFSRSGGSSRTGTDSENNVSESGFDEEMIGLVRQYDIIATEDITPLDQKLHRLKTSSSPSDLGGQTTDPVPTTSDGVRAIQSGFFQLLKDFILILPDSAIIDVLAHFVTVEVVLVLANHRDADVRTSIVRLLSHMSQRLSDAKALQCQKQHYWLHLGNQVSLHPVSASLVQASCQWVTGGSSLSIEQMAVQPDLRITDKVGLNVLMAILSQTVDDLFVFRPLIVFLDKIYGVVANADQRAFMVENGLIAALGKTILRFFKKYGSTQQDVVLNGLVKLCITISSTSLRGAAPINILWDLMNTLTFIEDHRNVAVTRGVRAVQAATMKYLLNSFQHTQKNRSIAVKLNDISLKHSTLSIAEIRIRFDLLSDRVVQFITTAEPSHQPADIESMLIETVLALTVNGKLRINNLIPWSLCPSRPLSLKLFTISILYRQTINGTVPLQLCCDLKVLKIMVTAILATDCLIISPEDQAILHRLAQSLFIQTPATVVTNLSQTLEKIETLRLASLRDRQPAIERTIFKFEPIVQPCIDSAMNITRSVVELQYDERRLLMNEMRADDESRLASDWQQLISRMTHEGAPWHSPRHYARSWKLDETEGPSRVRMRLKRCHLNIEDRFLMPDVIIDEKDASARFPLAYLQHSLVQRPHFPLNVQVLYTFACYYLPADIRLQGEMIVTETHLIFVANEVNEQPIHLKNSDIAEIWLRRHQHRDTGLEFFLASQRTVLFVFCKEAERDILINFYADKVVDSPDESRLAVLTQHWTEGHLTNWEYIMALNQISGRTYQDLMQYPIFPWILADYESQTLNLSDPKVYRRLDRPIAVQHKESEAHYLNNYNYLNQAKSELLSTGNVKASLHLTPYHYGSHYSNSGTVLHFLVRIPPFTKFFLRYQDNSFDLPDRTFHSMQTTWRLASRDSPTDVKEIIPEFFTLPEMLENYEQFRFGNRQSGERVDHVKLPAWAAESSRLFVLIHRQALESDAIRSQLHKWIDLVFGWKQTGAAAVEAINVFHPATYIGFSVTEGSDSVEQKAFETMVRTYGQMPRQLFDQPHSPALVPLRNGISDQLAHISSHVKGLRWGAFTGSPQLNNPVLVQQYPSDEHTIFQRIFTMPRTNVCYALPQGCNVMQGSEPDTMNVVIWNNPDRIVRTRPLSEELLSTSRPVPLLAASPDDPITCCGTDPNSDQLWFGHRSGRVIVYQWISVIATQQKFNKSRFIQHSSAFNFSSYNSAFRRFVKDHSDSTPSISSFPASKWKEPVVLIYHTDEVTAIAISDEFKIAVTVGLDGNAAIWDTNTLEYVRNLGRPSICPTAPVVLVTISPTLGDIVTVHSVEDTKSNEFPIASDDCLEATEDEEQILNDNVLDVELDDFVTVPLNLGKSKCVMRLHTVNAKYVCHLVDSDSIRCLGYSAVKEGTGVNVIATGYADGIVRLWSSWDLTLVREIHSSDFDKSADVISVVFSTYQHLVVLDSNNVIRVWQSDGLVGRQPKFPQMGIQDKRNSV